MTDLVPIQILEQKIYDGKAYPIVLSPNSTIKSLSDFTIWLQKNRHQIDKYLLEYKAILFRGFEVRDANDFHNVIVASDLAEMTYIGGAAVRTQLTSRVFTANESPSSEKIPFHHEMAQTPNPPSHLFFFCEVAPSIGGETPILPSSQIYDLMLTKYPDFMHKLESLGLKYIRVLPKEDDDSSAIGRGWKSTFLTESKEGAEIELQKLGSTWEWLENDNLKTITATIPGVKYDEGLHRTNKRVFFNSIVAAYAGWNDSRNQGEKAVVFGDGSYCDPEIMADALDMMESICVAFKWCAGDVLLLDNRTNMHSRRPFSGPRRILAGIARDLER
jgi:hypothetical protein